MAREIRALAPERDDLDLRQRLPVKGRYHEELDDMNARRIARLRAEEIAAFDRAFREHEDLLARSGYRLMDAAA